MAFSSYSATPSANTTINGINIAENCPAGNLNDAIRQLAADGRTLSDTVSGISTATLMPKSGGAFTGDITRSGAGGYLYNVAGAGGKVYVQPAGQALPSSPAEGTIVFQY